MSYIYIVHVDECTSGGNILETITTILSRLDTGKEIMIAVTMRNPKGIERAIVYTIESSREIHYDFLPHVERLIDGRCPCGHRLAISCIYCGLPYTECTCSGK